MLFKERNDPFAEVIEPPDPIRHSIAVILSHYSAAEEFLQGVEELNIASMLNDGEFGEHLELAGHFWVRVDADVKTTFAVNKPYHPLGLKLLRMRLNVKSLRVLHFLLLESSLRIVPMSA